MGANVGLLKQIVAGTVTFVSKEDGLPMIQNNPPLIEVNPAISDPNDATKAACRATPAAQAFIDAQAATASNDTAASATVAANPQTVTSADVGTLSATGAVHAGKPSYEIITGAVLPEAKRRGNQSGSGAPTKYPFEKMEVGASFFSANSEHSKGDAVKALGSTVSSQNRKYAVEVKDDAGNAKTKTVTRAVRDKKTHKAVLNADGSKQTETVTLPVLDYNRKFTIRPVKANEKYGNWTAPADGALVARTK